MIARAAMIVGGLGCAIALTEPGSTLLWLPGAILLMWGVARLSH